jgi:hypothetical protein
MIETMIRNFANARLIVVTLAAWPLAAWATPPMKPNVNISTVAGAPELRKPSEAVEWSASSKAGPIEVVRVGGDSDLAGVRANGVWVVQPEWLNIEVPFSRLGESTEAVALLEFDTGGSGCPLLFQVLDVSGAAPQVTDRFGTCGEASSIRWEGGRLVIRFPAYGRVLSREFTYSSGKLAEHSGRPGRHADRK